MKHKQAALIQVALFFVLSSSVMHWRNPEPTPQGQGLPCEGMDWEKKQNDKLENQTDVKLTPNTGWKSKEKKQVIGWGIWVINLWNTLPQDVVIAPDL